MSDNSIGDTENTAPFLCPLCNIPFKKKPFATEEVHGQVLAIRECPQCRLHIVWPRLSDPQGNYVTMTPEYFENKYGAMMRGEKLHDRHKNYIQESSLVASLVPEHGKVLDVGCNSGWLIGYLKKAGLEPEGVEPSKFLGDIAHEYHNVTIHNCFLQDLTNRDNYFDATTATDVIEHINPEDIVSFIQAMHRILKPGGVAIIKTPNVFFTRIKCHIVRRIPQWITKPLIKQMDIWDAKEHVLQWNVHAMKKLFEANGFETVRSFAPRPIQTHGSHPLGYVLRSLIYISARIINPFGVAPIAQDICFIARKKK